jgi:hypothetical protein
MQAFEVEPSKYSEVRADMLMELGKTSNKIRRF